MKINEESTPLKAVSDERMSQVAGGDTNFEYDPKGGLADAIARNLVAGAQYFAIYLGQRGQASVIREVLDSIADHNDAWNTAETFYLVFAK